MMREIRRQKKVMVRHGDKMVSKIVACMPTRVCVKCEFSDLLCTCQPEPSKKK